GSFVIAGPTPSTNLPVAGAYQSTRPGGATDAYVAKFNPTGASLAFSTYLGGAAGAEFAYDVAFDPSGRCCVVGYTDSNDFPTAAPVQSALAGGGDVFVTRLRADGASPETSTFLGGTDADVPLAMAVDSSGG